MLINFIITSENSNASKELYHWMPIYTTISHTTGSTVRDFIGVTFNGSTLKVVDKYVNRNGSTRNGYPSVEILGYK